MKFLVKLFHPGADFDETKEERTITADRITYHEGGVIAFEKVEDIHVTPIFVIGSIDCSIEKLDEEG